MRQILVHVLVLCLLFGFPGTLRAGDMRWVFQGGEKKWQSHLEMDYRPGQHDDHGLVLSPFMTLAQDEKSLVFINLRNTLFWQDGDFAHEINAGGGYRRLMGDSASWILGGYAFYDRLDSLYDNKFDQGTIGFEGLSQNWDLRVNGYIADMEKKEVGNRARNVQLNGTSLRLNANVEQSMSGFDGEIGWRLPFAPDGLLGDTRIYAGGFFFDASKVSSLGGPRARFETRIHEVPFLWEGSRITVGAEYTWDDERSSEVTGLVSLRIPIGPPSRKAPLSYVERRMTDRVVRDVAVVSDLGADSSESVVTRTGAPIDDVYFFDRDGGDPNCTFDTPCTIQEAIDTGENNLLIGLNRTFEIDLDPAGRQLRDGQTVMGGGSSLVVFGEDSGQSAVFTAPGGPATLCCTGGTGLNLARNNTIVGLIFEDIGTALAFDDLDSMATRLDIYDNSFRNLAVPTAVSLTVDNGAPLTAWIQDNLIEDMPVGIDVTALGTFTIDLTIAGNTFRNVGTGIQATLDPTGATGPSSWTDVIANNRFEDGDTGIAIDSYFTGTENYTHVSTVTGNYFRGLDRDDYEFHLNGPACCPLVTGLLDLQLDVAGNHSEDGDNFLDFEIDPVYYGHVALEIVDNDIENTNDDAIEIDIYGGPDVTANISRNHIRGVDGGSAISVNINRSGDENGHTLTIADNQIADVYGADAIDVDFSYGRDADVSVTGNDISDVDADGAADGINVYFFRHGHDQGGTANVSNNTISDIDDDGMEVNFQEGRDGTVTVANNDVSDVGEDGIEVGFDDNGHAVGSSASVTGNVVSDTEDDGIQVQFNYGYDGTLTVANNDVSETGDNGIEVEFDTNGHNVGNTASVSGNVIADADDDGIDFSTDEGDGTSFDMDVVISDNVITSVGAYVYDPYYGYYGVGDGIDVEIDDTGHDVGNTVTVTGNVVDGAEDEGIEIDVDDSFDTTVTVAGNAVRDVSSDGVDIDVQDTGHNVGNTISVTGNDIGQAGAEGIDIYLGYDDAVVTVASNAITDVQNGIEIRLEETYNVTATIAGNSISEVERDGIDVYLNDSESGQLTIAGNVISGAASDPAPNMECDGCGIYVDVYNDSNGNVIVINGNTVEHSDDTGIGVLIEVGSDSNTVRVGGNLVNQSDDYGIFLEDFNPMANDLPAGEADNVVNNSGTTSAVVNGFTGQILVNGVLVP